MKLFLFFVRLKSSTVEIISLKSVKKSRNADPQKFVAQSRTIHQDDHFGERLPWALLESSPRNAELSIAIREQAALKSL